MPKIIIEDLSIGLENDSILPSSINKNTQINKLTTKGSLVRHGMYNPFMSLGSIGLFTQGVESTTSLSNSFNINYIDNDGFLYTDSTANSGYIYTISYDINSIGESYNIGASQSNELYDATNNVRPIGSTSFKFSSVSGTYEKVVLASSSVSVGSYSSTPTLFVVKSDSVLTNVSGSITGFPTTDELFPNVNEVTTPLLSSQTNALYILSNKYLSKITSGGSFVGQLVTAPGGFSFVSMLEFNGKLWILSNVKGMNSLICIFGYKYNTTQGFDNTIPIDDAITVYDMSMLDGAPAVIGLNSSNKLCIYRFDGTKFVKIKTIGTNRFDYNTKSDSYHEFNMSNRFEKRLIEYNNGIAFLNKATGCIYWIGKINKQSPTYSLSKLFDLSKQNTIYSRIQLSKIRDSLILICRIGNTTGNYSIYTINPRNSSNSYSRESVVQFSDIQLPSSTVVTRIKLLISGDNEGITFTDSELIKVSITGDGRNEKTFTEKAQDAIKRGYISIPYNNSDASRIGIKIETNLVGYTNLHKLPVLDRIEIDYKASTKI